MGKVSDENLAILIDGLAQYKQAGIVDPWVLDDGTMVEPLDILIELQELRGISHATDNPGQYPKPKELQGDIIKPPYRPAIRGFKYKGKDLAD